MRHLLCVFRAPMSNARVFRDSNTHRFRPLRTLPNPESKSHCYSQQSMIIYTANKSKNQGNPTMQYPIRTQKRILFMSVAIVLLLSSLQTISYAQGKSKLYWTQRTKISRANLDGSNVEDVITDRYLVEDIAIDTQNGKIFWIETDVAQFKNVELGTGTIYRSDSNGFNIKEIITGYKLPLEGGAMGQDCIQGVCKAYIVPAGQEEVEMDPELVFNPASIAVDTQRNKVYWTDDFHDRFQRANIDGSNVDNIRTVQGLRINDIELDLKRNRLYWLKQNSIKRMDFDGNQVEDVLVGWNVTILNFDLDEIAQHIYWTSSITGIIHRATSKGADIQEIVTDLKEPYNIVVDTESQKLYWSSWDRQTNLYKIQQSNLDGSDVTDIVTDLGRINGLALDTEGIYAVSPVDRLTTMWGNIKVE